MAACNNDHSWQQGCGRNASSSCRAPGSRHLSTKAVAVPDTVSLGTMSTLQYVRAVLVVAVVACTAAAVSATLPDVGKDMADIVSEKGYPIEECTCCCCCPRLPAVPCCRAVAARTCVDTVCMCACCVVAWLAWAVLTASCATTCRPRGHRGRVHAGHVPHPVWTQREPADQATPGCAAAARSAGFIVRRLWHCAALHAAVCADCCHGPAASAATRL